MKCANHLLGGNAQVVTVQACVKDAATRKENYALLRKQEELLDEFQRLCHKR